MTVTVDIKELREFERNVQEWAARRGLIALKASEEAYKRAYNPIMGTSSSFGNYIKEALDEWDKINPPPKLIPDL